MVETPRDSSTHPPSGDWRSEAWITSIAVTADGRSIATGHLFDFVEVWDAESNERIHTFETRPEPGYLGSVGVAAFHPTLPLFACYEAAGTVCVMETERWQRVLTLADEEISAIALAFHPVRPALLMSRQDCRLEFWNLEAHRLIWEQKLQDTAEVLSVSGTGSGMAVLSDGAALLVDVDHGTCRPASWIGNSVEQGGISFDGSHLVTASRSGQLAVWLKGSQSLVHSCDARLRDIGRFSLASRSHTVAVRSDEGRCVVWNYLSSKPTFEYQTRADRVTPICLTPDGTTLLHGDTDGCLRRVRL